MYSFRAATGTNKLIIVVSGIVAGLGIALRIGLICMSANLPVSPVSGTGDQVRYETLAQSVFEGKGLTYEGQPTALRPPLYPLLLAASHLVFGAKYYLATRLIQFLLGFALAYLSLLLTARLFGMGAAPLGAAIALAFPTLSLTIIELQTELLTSLLVALFLCLSIATADQVEGTESAMGLVSGVAALTRFNCALLPIMGVIVSLWFRRNLPKTLTVAIIASLLLAPWIIRNAIVFKGQVLFSSHGGINLLEGILTPQGRAQANVEQAVKKTVGWEHTDIEINSPHRLNYPSEAKLDRQAMAAAITAWTSLKTVSALRLFALKVMWFCLSIDQFLDTSSFSNRLKIVRKLGVITYWSFLALAIVGWRKLFQMDRKVSLVIAIYALWIIVAHLPFVMNTRLRIPFLDFLIGTLAAGGICTLLKSWKERGATKVFIL
jgi:4-amino-4-deoxy-L-arabinose transferase-like glycosyltransferase